MLEPALPDAYRAPDEQRIASDGTREQRTELALRYLIEERADELDEAVQGFDLARFIVAFAVVAIAVGGVATVLSGMMRTGFLEVLALPVGASLYWAWAWTRVRASLRELRRSLSCADQAGLDVAVEKRDPYSPALRWHFLPRFLEPAAARAAPGHVIPRDVKLSSVMDWIVLVQRANEAGRMARRRQGE